MLYNPDKPLTLAQIQADPALHAQMLDLARRRFRIGTDYVKPWHEKWVRFWKIYRSIVDAVDDPDEANYMISYAFGIVEDLVSRIAEPILQMRPPCRVAAKIAGQEQQADNFASICSNYFQTSRYQLDKTDSIREMVVIGNTWEMDGWAAEYAKGRKWDKVQRFKPIEKFKSILTGREHPSSALTPYMSTEEVSFDVPVKVGYFTRFPWAFDVIPEPYVKNVRDMHWLLENERAVAIEDLQKRTFVDPQTKQRVGVFNFGPMLKAIGDHLPGSIKPTQMELQHDYGQEAMNAMAGQSLNPNSPVDQDMDRVSLLWVWEQNRMFCVANGAYIVAYRENIFQVPRIPYRLNGYTPQKEFLFALGALEPIESLIYELSDIHKLSMRNWVRIINRMVAYNDESVPYPDDFKPRAGGRIRVRPPLGGSVSSEIHPIEQADVTGSMLAQESNSKGLMERVISLADFSPGTDGTKQTHKTLGGLMEIQKNLAMRSTTIRRTVLANYQDQMWFMEKLYSQFMMDRQPFTIYGPDGSTRLAQFDLWDIYTGGQGFDYVVEYDPSFGDDSVARNQLMVLMDLSIKYENARMQLGRKDLPQANLGEVMRKNYRVFGWSDTSRILSMADNVLEPMTEFQMMLSGQPVAPNPAENLTEHLVEHMMQLQSPMLQKGVADGSVDPKVLAMLKAHIQATQMMAGEIVAHPEIAAKQKIAQGIAAGNGMQRQPLPGAAGGNPNLSAGSVSGSADGMGVTVPNTRTPTPRDAGMHSKV